MMVPGTTGPGMSFWKHPRHGELESRHYSTAIARPPARPSAPRWKWGISSSSFSFPPFSCHLVISLVDRDIDLLLGRHTSAVSSPSLSLSAAPVLSDQEPASPGLAWPGCPTVRTLSLWAPCCCWKKRGWMVIIMPVVTPKVYEIKRGMEVEEVRRSKHDNSVCVSPSLLSLF